MAIELRFANAVRLRVPVRCSRISGLRIFLLALVTFGPGRVSIASPPPVPTPTSVDSLVSELERIATTLDPSPIYRQDFDRLAERHSLPTNEALFRDYVRLKTVFEATREAGWWRIRWDITDREPRSDAIWASWKKLDGRTPRVTAIAECDEISALTSFLARRLGVRGVGLFWPQWNHTVAIWRPKNRRGTEARIVLPTSQVFLGETDGFDTRFFDSRTQKNLYEYVRGDIPGSQILPADFFRFLVTAARRYAAASDRTQNELRVLRSRVMSGGAPGDCVRSRNELERKLRAEGAPLADVAAVVEFGKDLVELGDAPAGISPKFRIEISTAPSNGPRK